MAFSNSFKATYGTLWSCFFNRNIVGGEKYDYREREKRTDESQVKRIGNRTPPMGSAHAV